MENVEFAKIKVPPEKNEAKLFYRLIEMARKEKIEYLVVMTPQMFEQLKTEKFIFDKMKGERLWKSKN